MLEPEYRGIYSKLVLYFDRFVYTIVISLVIFGVAGYICSQAIENSGIEIWAVIFIAALLGALLSLLYFKPDPEVRGRFSIRNLIFGLIPFLVLLPGVVALLFSVRVQLSFHGSFHLGYIYQILNGLAPPENVVLPGYPANVYWIFHTLIATLTDIFNTPPPFIAALVNIAALIISFYWIRKILNLLGLANRNSLITSCYSLLILSSTNIFGALHVVLNYILNKGYSKVEIIESVTYQSMRLGGDFRLINLTKKFFNFSGAPLGILYFTFALYLSVRISKGDLTSKNILLLAIAISGALMFHITTGAYMLIIIPLSISISLLIANKQYIGAYFRNTPSIELLLVVLGILILFLPIAHYVYLAVSAMPVQTKIGTSMRYNLMSILYTIYPLIPLSLFGVYLYHKKKFGSVTLLCVISTLGYVVAILLDFPGRNQYKFIYLSTIVFSILSVMTLDYLFFGLKGALGYFGKSLSLAVIVITGSSVLLSGFGYLTSNWFLDKSYYYEDSDLSMREGSKYKDSFVWIRGNTTSGTIVILPFPSKDTGRVDGLSGSVYIVTQRLPYVAYGHIYSKGIKEYAARRENVQLFYSDSTPVDKKVEILGEFAGFSRKRQSVLLIPNKDVESLRPYLDKLKLIYRGRDAELYSFN
jgi:hypothetical protein